MYNKKYHSRHKAHFNHKKRSHEGTALAFWEIVKGLYSIPSASVCTQIINDF